MVIKMLVIARRSGESFYVGNDVLVTVLEVLNDNKVKIAIEAPKDVLILRKELADAQRVNKEAANSDEGGLSVLRQNIKR